VTTTLAAPARRQVTVAVRGGGTRWCWGTRLLATGIAGWLVFICLHRLLSGGWWGWLLPALLPPWLFVAVPVAVVALAPLARPAKYRIMLAAAAALLLGADLSGVNPAALGAGPPAAPAGALRLFSWNTDVWHDGSDPDDFYGFLAEQRADIYLLQEYKPGLDAHPSDVAGRLDLARLRRALPAHRLVIVGELLTASRFPIVSVAPLPAPPPGASWDREYETVKVLRTDVLVGGRVLSVYNTHVHVQVDLGQTPLNPRFYTFLRAFAGERAANLRAIEADLDRNPGPVLLAGDFNTTPAMGDLRGVRARLRDATPALRSVYPVSWRDGWLPWWRLDWAFTSDSVRVHRYALLDPRGLSDHRPQSLVVSLVAAP
jgi:endonuclease/exonuclease/phosphatase (EEP) superfamily protein YafD